MEVVIWRHPASWRDSCLEHGEKHKRKSMPYHQCHPCLILFASTFFQQPDLVFLVVWQVAKVEIREVVRQVPKVEVSRHVNDMSTTRRCQLPFPCHFPAISLPFWPWILQVKYVEKKVTKQVIQYASRLGDICASTFPPAKVCQKYEIT